MRECEKNKTTVWIIKPTGFTKVVDDDGNYTGEKVATYSTPIKTRLLLYFAPQSMLKQIFGKDYSFDGATFTNTVGLDSTSLLFLTEPTSNFSNTYDYSISSIGSSLDTKYYGLMGRVK